MVAVVAVVASPLSSYPLTSLTTHIVCRSFIFKLISLKLHGYVEAIFHILSRPMLPSNDYDDCDKCVPDYLRRGLGAYASMPDFSTSPFIVTFLVVSFFAWTKLFPVLSGQQPTKPSSAEFKRQPALNLPCASSIRTWVRSPLDIASLITFSATIGLSTVLAELIFCEISNLVDPAARSVALESTISFLLVSLILVTPTLEIHSITSALGIWNLRVRGWRGRLFLVILLDIIGLIMWLMSFWWFGRTILGASKYHNHNHDGPSRQTIREGSLERIGIIGVSLMASLAGFAAVSSLWQTFGVKERIVTEADIARKQHGLEATTDLLKAKESRLRALERKMADANIMAKNDSPSTFMGRILGSLSSVAAGSGSTVDSHEYSSLQMETSGLEVMRSSLSNSLQLLQSRHDAQRRAITPFGRLCISASYLFSLYCLYRIFATSLATLRRWWSPKTTFASTDPINNFLALLARAWDPTIDREAWARQISFLLSGVMLLASFNAVLQTVLLFARFTPSRLRYSSSSGASSHQKNTLALLVSQISATYVVSSALLLRSNLPKEMGHVIDGVLPLESAFVEMWFEAWFLGSCAVTAVGIWMVRHVAGGTGMDDEDWLAHEGDLESGKRKA